MEQVAELEQTETVPSISFLLFSAGGAQYAVLAADVQEIVHGAKIHELPFVPPYIEGVINTRGTPYTVVNLPSMFAAQATHAETDARDTSSNVFLVFTHGDQFCLRITTADTMLSVPEDELLDKNGAKTTVSYQNREIKIVSSAILAERLCKDLEQ